MNFFEQEMRKLFGESPVIQEAKYSGKTLIGKVDDELRVKLQFITTGYADHYDSIRMRIINRTEGEVDSQTFKFTDIAGMTMERQTGMVIIRQPSTMTRSLKQSTITFPCIRMRAWG